LLRQNNIAMDRFLIETTLGLKKYFQLSADSQIAFVFAQMFI